MRSSAREIQHITYNEFLPLHPRTGRDPGVQGLRFERQRDASHLLFSTRLLPHRSHAALAAGPDAEQQACSRSSTAACPLRTMFFVPDQVIHMGGIEPILRGLTMQKAEQVDEKVVDDVRNFLFGPPGSGGLDLISLNIQRGRDHGIGSYNQSRVDFGLPAATDRSTIFRRIRPSRRSFAGIYKSIDDVDAWPGAIAEDHVAGRDGRLARLHGARRISTRACVTETASITRTRCRSTSTEWVNKQSLWRTSSAATRPSRPR